MVAGTTEGVTMVEGGAFEVSEQVLIAAIEFAHQNIKELCAMQQELFEGRFVDSLLGAIQEAGILRARQGGADFELRQSELPSEIHLPPFLPRRCEHLEQDEDVLGSQTVVFPHRNECNR